MKRKIVVFSGAGISAESGISTFRDKGGLWDEFKVEEVAYIGGWKKNKQKVLDFYNKRRAEMIDIKPNDAHLLVHELENLYDVTVVTQNVDDLHEKAGSKNIIHLHGELNKMRSSKDDKMIFPCIEDIKLGDKCPKGSQFRPHIVWFGENLDPTLLAKAVIEIQNADVMIVVGTSLQVEPAASLLSLTKETCIIYYVDPGELNINMDDNKLAFFYHHKEKATVGMKQVCDDIISYLL